MKKLVALFVGLIMIGIFSTSVSADEYEVRKGDTLWNIAIKHDITVDELMKINKLNSSLIYPKQVLKLNESKIEHYVVHKGDTLWSIASKHHLTVDELMKINKLNSTLIYPKQVLKLNESEKEYYVVQKGDTLSRISRAYGSDVTVANLKEWNDLSSNLIIPGQQLIVIRSDASQLAGMEEQTTESPVSDSVNETTANVAESNEKSKEQKTKVEGKTLSVEATAYTAYCTGCSGITATGLNLKENPNMKVISVDPSVIPLGTKVYVEGYGYAVAADTGSAIIGNKIDVHLPTKEEAYSWGRKIVEVTILE